MNATDYIPPDQARTLDGLFRLRVQRTPAALAYRYFSRADGRWHDLAWRDIAAQAARWQQALAGEAWPAGERVALLLRNGPDWVACEQAALGLGLVTVPLYLEDRPDSIAYILNDAGCRLLVVAEERYRRLAPVLPQCPALQRVVVVCEDHCQADDGRVRSLAEWLPPAASMPLRERAGDPCSLATLVYTSGTTGRPKGVMLSHHNILANAWAALSLEQFHADDLFLSFLPLSHMLERTAGYYLPMMAGSTVAYARSVQQLAEDLQSQRPTLLIAVPRVFERVYGRLHEQLARRSVLARTLFRITLAAGWRRFEAQQGRGSPGWACWAWPLLRRLVADKVTARLGGRLRIAVSGGAALPVPVARFFLGLGVTLVQGYGLTEASPVVSVNLPGNNAPASVGPPLPGVELRIGAEQEVQVRGATVMQGYWNQPAATTAVLDTDGWLHTGDQGRIEHGRLYLTGRLKDILVLSNGEKVPPAEMEGAICLDPLFEQAMIVGEGRAYLAALVVLDGAHWPAFARQAGVAPDDLASPLAQRLVLQRITAALHDFPGHAKVRRVALLCEPWTVENGLLTPTLKLRRAAVLTRHAGEISVLFT